MTNREGLPAVRYCLKLSTRAYVGRDSWGGIDVSVDRKKQATPFLYKICQSNIIQSQWLWIRPRSWTFFWSRKNIRSSKAGFLFGVFLYLMCKNKFWGRKRKHFVWKCYHEGFWWQIINYFNWIGNYEPTKSSPVGLCNKLQHKWASSHKQQLLRARISIPEINEKWLALTDIMKLRVLSAFQEQSESKRH